MKRNHPHLIVLLLIAGLAGSAFAGPWTQKKGGLFAKLGANLICATQFYEPNGNRVDIPTFTDYTQSIYAEYGLRDNLTLVGNFPFKRIALNRVVFRQSGVVSFPGDEKTGIADPEIALRYRLINWGATVLSMQAGLGIPLGDDQQKNGLLTGDGEWNQKIVLGIGHSFYPVPVYGALEVGFNNRTDGYSDEFLYGAEAGYTRGRITGILRLRGLESLDNGEDSVTGGMGGLYANNQSFLAFGPELLVNLNRTFAVAASVEGAFRGENVLSAPNFGFGIFFRR